VNRVLAVRVAILVTLVFVYEAVTRAKMLGPTLSVPPSAMVTDLAAALMSGDLGPGLLRTATEIFASFGLAALAGIVTGALLSRSAFFAAVIEPTMIAYYAVPLFALYPLLIVLFGAGLWPIVALGTLNAYGAIAINTLVALRGIKRVYLAVGRTTGCSRAQMIRHIVVPATVPQVFVGLKLGFVYALIGCVAAEFILATAGLGYQVKFAYENFASQRMFAVMLLIVVLSVAANSVLSAIERRLARYRSLA